MTNKKSTMNPAPRQSLSHNNPAQDDLQYFRDELAAEARAIFEPQPATAAPPPATLTLHRRR